MESTRDSNFPNPSEVTTPGFKPGNGASTVDKAASSAHSAIDDAARKAKPAVDRVAAMAHETADKVESAGGLTAEWLTARGEQLSATQKKLVDDTCEYVSANPLKAIGIALAAGFVLSRIVR